MNDGRSTAKVSGRDLAGLAGAIRTLLSPLDYPGLTPWRSEVARHVHRLIGADGASTVFRDTGAPLLIADGLFNTKILAEYAERWYGRLPGEKRRRAMGLQVWTREATWPSNDVQRTDYYHDFCVPHANRDSAGMLARIGSGDEIELYIHSSKVNHFVPGGREEQLLSLLQPALEAGAVAARRLNTLRGSWSMLDGLGVPLLLFDERGTLLHLAPSAVPIVECAVTGSLVKRAAAQLARQSMALLAGKRGEAASGSSGRLVLATPVGPFALHASRVAAGVVAPQAAYLVLVTPPHQAPSVRDLTTRFGLTEREGDVALLLARGQRNRQIASELGVSIHTVRRHVEHVLSKLGVPTRAAVADRIR